MGISSSVRGRGQETCVRGSVFRFLLLRTVMTTSQEAGTERDATCVNAGSSSSKDDTVTSLIQQLLRDNKQMLGEIERDREKMEDRLNRLEERSSWKLKAGSVAGEPLCGTRAHEAAMPDSVASLSPQAGRGTTQGAGGRG